MSDQGYIIKKYYQNAHLFRKSQPLLRHLDCELTERCNNVCVHCYINQPAQNTEIENQELTCSKWKQLFKQAADLGALSIRFTGGEPLLRKDFTDLYLYARSLGLKILIFTNARAITESIADLFAEVRPLMKVEISVYGLTEQTYDKVANQKGAYAEFRKGLDMLFRKNVPILLKPTVLKINQTEMMGLDSNNTKLFGYELSAINPNQLYLRTRRDSRLKNHVIENLRFSPNEYVKLVSRHGNNYRNSMIEFMRNFLYPQGDALFNCGAGESGCIDAFGQYQMCMMLRHPEMVYNLKSGNLYEALTEVFPRLKQRRATNSEYLYRCARCFIKSLCEQCPGRSWSEHGTLDTPVEYLCQVAHAQAYYLGLLQNGEYAWEVKDWKKRVSAITQIESKNKV